MKNNNQFTSTTYAFYNPANMKWPLNATTGRKVQQPKPWHGGQHRSMGGPFDILYIERGQVQEFKKRARNPHSDQTLRDKVLRSLNAMEPKPKFSPHIASRAESDRTQAIRGRGNK